VKTMAKQSTSMNFLYAMGRSRKGFLADMTWVVVWLALFGIIMSSLYGYAIRMQSDTRFERIKTATDMGLLLSAVPAAGNIRLDLGKNENSIQTMPGEVRAFFIQRTMGPDGQPVRVQESARYIKDSAISIPSGIAYANQDTIIVKNGRAVIFPGEIGTMPRLNQFTCQSSEPLILSEIVLDPGHGGTGSGQDTGALLGPGGFAESEADTVVANEIQNTIQNSRAIAVTMTRAGNNPVSFLERSSRVGKRSFVVSLHAHAGEKPSVTVFVPSGDRNQKSAGVACKIINALLADTALGLNGGNIAVVEAAGLKDDDNKRLLFSGTGGVHIVLNSLDKITTLEINRASSLCARAIGQAILEAGQ